MEGMGLCELHALFVSVCTCKLCLSFTTLQKKLRGGEGTAHTLNFQQPDPAVTSLRFHS